MPWTNPENNYRLWSNKIALTHKDLYDKMQENSLGPNDIIDKVYNIILKRYPELVLESCFSGHASKGEVCFYVYDRKIIKSMEQILVKYLNKYGIFVEGTSIIWTDEQYSVGYSTNVLHALHQDFRYNILGNDLPRFVVSISFAGNGYRLSSENPNFKIITYINSLYNMLIVIFNSSRVNRLFSKDVKKVLVPEYLRYLNEHPYTKRRTI